MTFDEVLAEVQALLQREGRVAYRMLLKRCFALNDDDVEDLKADLIDAKRLAVDEEEKVLVWVGDSSPATSVQHQVSEHVHGHQSTIHNQESQPIAERRQLTVMFCDLVGSTSLSPSSSTLRSCGKW